MCTCISCYGDAALLGRNLDVDTNYGERIIIAPRSFLFPKDKEKRLADGAAIIGIGTVIDGYPMYFDAVNPRFSNVFGSFIYHFFGFKRKSDYHMNNDFYTAVFQAKNGFIKDG